MLKASRMLLTDSLEYNRTSNVYLTVQVYIKALNDGRVMDKENYWKLQCEV
ncbi:hypothetical protein Mapa_009960 [Marchantia paleacea]|nr:hypothetical protein Mapa_009960 [Marchantia paleacea]